MRNINEVDIEKFSPESRRCIEAAQQAVPSIVGLGLKDLSAIAVFGSAAKNNAKADSDVDVALIFGQPLETARVDITSQVLPKLPIEITAFGTNHLIWPMSKDELKTDAFIGQKIDKDGIVLWP